MVIDKVLNQAKLPVQTKQELFLRLCSLNYLNTLVKKKEFKSVLGYGMIKPKVMHLAMNLVKNDKTCLCEDICFRNDEDCLFVKCYGLQFSFHHVGVRILEEECPELRNDEVQWDGVRLQPIAEPLYDLAKETFEQGLGDEVVVERIKALLTQE